MFKPRFFLLCSPHVSVLTAASDTPAALRSRAGGVAGKQQGQGCPLQWEGGSRAEVSRALRKGHLQKDCCWSVPPAPLVESRVGQGFLACHPLCYVVDLFLSVIEQMAKICKKCTITRKGKAETLFFFPGEFGKIMANIHNCLRGCHQHLLFLLP